MALPNSQKRIPPNQGNRARGFDRQSFDSLRNAQLRDLAARENQAENPENVDDLNESSEQAQNQNNAEQNQQSQQAQNQNNAQRQMAQQQKQMAARLIRQNLRKEMLKKKLAQQIAKEGVKKGGTSLLASTAGGISCTGCLTILAYVIIIGAVLAIIIYAANFLGLIPN